MYIYYIIYKKIIPGNGSIVPLPGITQAYRVHTTMVPPLAVALALVTTSWLVAHGIFCILKEKENISYIYI